MGGSGLVLTFDYTSFSSSCRVVEGAEVDRATMNFLLNPTNIFFVGSNDPNFRSSRAGGHK
jgi:hypothetical protein